MSACFLTDEHVSCVFVMGLQSNGYDVVRANDVFGEATNDETLLGHCAIQGLLLITNRAVRINTRATVYT